MQDVLVTLHVCVCVGGWVGGCVGGWVASAQLHMSLSIYTCCTPSVFVYTHLLPPSERERSERSDSEVLGQRCLLFDSEVSVEGRNVVTNVSASSPPLQSLCELSGIRPFWPVGLNLKANSCDNNFRGSSDNNSGYLILPKHLIGRRLGACARQDSFHFQGGSERLLLKLQKQQRHVAKMRPHCKPVYETSSC